MGKASSASGGADSDLAVAITSALKKNADVALMSSAANVDALDTKGTESGDKLEKQKLVACVTGSSPENLKFRADVQESRDKFDESKPAALQILLKNPDTFRVLRVKIPPSTASVHPLLEYVSKMRSYMVLELETEFAAKHGGRISHATTKDSINSTGWREGGGKSVVHAHNASNLHRLNTELCSC